MSRVAVIAVTGVFWMVSAVFGDDTFDKLLSGGKYEEAIEYADQKIPAGSRTPDIWVKLAEANEKLGLTEKALACYMVSWRMNPKDYPSLLGAARIYNKLNQPDNAMDMAKKALEQNFTGEASWEYAKACIDLKRPADAKKALQKVIETDPSNLVANRELGQIYYDDKEFQNAIPLLLKAYEAKKDADVAFKIGKCYVATGQGASSVDYLQKAIEQKPNLYEAGLELARAFYQMSKHLAAASEFDRIENKIPFSAQDYFMMAVALEGAGKQAQSIDAYKKAIGKFGASKDTDAIAARMKVGQFELDKKNYPAAISEFNFVASADPSARKVTNIYFLLAEAYLGAKNTSSAIASLEKAISLDKNNIEAYARLGDLYRTTNQHAKAKSTYEAMMALRPDDPDVFLILGEYNLKAKQYSSALDNYAKSNSLKKSAQALEGVALSARALGQWDKAGDAAESAVAADGSLIESRKVLAEAMMRKKAYREALPHLEKIVEKESKDVSYWDQLATCYESVGDKSKLADADKKIVAMDRTSIPSRQRLAKYSLETGDKQTAYDMFKDLASLTPKDPNVFKNLYDLSKDRKDVSSAISYLKAYLALKPDDAASQRDLGDLLYEKKDFDGALAAYRMAIKIDPSIKGFYTRYAEIVIAKGQQEEVIRALQGVIKSGEADVGTYTTLGMIYQKKKSYSSAIEMYQKALQLNPQDSDALVALGDCQAATGALNDAVITYEQAVMLNPKAVDEYKTLGELYMRQKKTDQAMGAFQKYLDAGGKDDKVAEQIGMEMYRNKKYDEAQKYLGKVGGSAAGDFALQQAYGESCFYSGDLDKAIEILKGLVARNPKSSAKADIILMIAQAYEKKNQNSTAVNYYGDYLDAGARNADIAFKRAYMEETVNQLTNAQKHYEQNIKIYTGDYRNYLQLGMMYSKKKETAQSAISLLRKVASIVDTIPAVWLEIGRVYGKLGMEDEELEAYRKYLKNDPQNVEGNVRMGLILLKKNKISEGMIYLETANTIKPGDLEVMRALSKGYLATNRTREAESLLNKVKEIKADDIEIRSMLVQLYESTGDSRKAILEIEELLKLKSSNELLLKYAKLMFSSGKTRDAEEAIENIRATDPENLDALMLLALIQRDKKKYDEAIETYKEVMYIDGNYAPAVFERAEVYMLQSKPQWAQKFYERALRTDPKHARAELGLAKIAKMRDDKAAYIMHLTKAYQLDLNDEEIKSEYKKSKR